MIHRNNVRSHTSTSKRAAFILISARSLRTKYHQQGHRKVSAPGPNYLCGISFANDLACISMAVNERANEVELPHEKEELTAVLTQ